MQYNKAIVNKGAAAVAANFQSKNKAFARGLLDTGDDSSSCAPFGQGQNRHERFFEFITAWAPSCANPSTTVPGTGHCDTVDLIQSNHDAGLMFASTAGQTRLFLDNFYGNGSRAYDFGYPRVQWGDDPYPNPVLVDTPIAGPSTAASASNMKYAGCWSDSSSINTMRTKAYDNSFNTIELCTQTCSKLGYQLAGLEYGSQCFCDNSISGSAYAALDMACFKPCAGNANQTCGDGSRMSIYASGTVTQRPLPINVASVLQGNYTYAACYSDSSSSRSLSAIHYSSSSSMTVESCASYCSGYEYFGVEYSNECYCGSYFSNITSLIGDASCYAMCSGNELEVCGGPSALSVYKLSPNASVKKIQQPTAGSLCPAADGKLLADGNGLSYAVYCSATSSVTSYSSVSVSNSYLDCMTLCDSNAKCGAFTYVGVAYGAGAGICYLKTGLGSLTSRGTGTISAYSIERLFADFFVNSIYTLQL
ncbi:WSC-domain-containing protein [Thozetella sp. PMI_491]|nr:WSC-domain-containing protein [Thozetella sp. PMI_491]